MRSGISGILLFLVYTGIIFFTTLDDYLATHFIALALAVLLLVMMYRKRRDRK